MPLEHPQSSTESSGINSTSAHGWSSPSDTSLNFFSFNCVLLSRIIEWIIWRVKTDPSLHPKFIQTYQCEALKWDQLTMYLFYSCLYICVFNGLTWDQKQKHHSIPRKTKLILFLPRLLQKLPKKTSVEWLSFMSKWVALDRVWCELI